MKMMIHNTAEAQKHRYSPEEAKALGKYFRDTLGGVLCAARAKQPWSTRPKEDMDARGAVPWTEHAERGWLKEGIKALEEGDPACEPYLVPGSVHGPVAGLYLACLDLDKEEHFEPARETLCKLPYLLLQPKPGNPKRAHLWTATTRKMKNGKLYANGLHVGDIRCRTEDDKSGVGVRLYAGEGLALMQALQATEGSPWPHVPAAKFDLLVTKPKPEQAPRQPYTAASLVKKLSIQVSGNRYYSMRDGVAALVGYKRWNAGAEEAVKAAYVEICRGDYEETTCRQLVDKAAQGALANYESGKWEWPSLKERTPKKAPKKNFAAAVEQMGGSETLREALAKKGCMLRFNLRSLQREVKIRDSAWQGLEERREAHMRVLINGVEWEDTVWRTLLNNTFYHVEVDPFRKWLDGLPPWDKTPRVDSWCAKAWTVARGYEELARWASRHIFLGSVKRTLEPGSKLDATPVLVGDQGLGKSLHLEEVFPDDMREFFGDTLDLSGRPKEMLEAVLGKVLVEIGEMNGLAQGKIEVIKGFMTRRVDNGVRLAYRRDVEQAKRRCVFCGTANNDGRGILPNDASGNRRWVPVSVVARGEHPAVLMLDREQFWAEAVERVKHGEDPAFPQELEGQHREYAEEARRRDPLEDAVNRVADQVRRRMAADKLLKGVPILQLMGEIGMTGTEVATRGEKHGDQQPSEEKQPRRRPEEMPQAEMQRLATALRNCGWTKRRSRMYGEKTVLWVPPALEGAAGAEEGEEPEKALARPAQVQARPDLKVVH